MLSSCELRKTFKSNFRNRKKIFGGWTSIYHPSIIDIISRANFDFIGIDLEHSTISLEQSLNIMNVCQGRDVLCFPRLPILEPVAMKRLLDSGADGLLAPLISNKQDVMNFIQWSKYPPQGKRSYGVARGQGFGFDFEVYIKQWNESSILIAQVETIEGVEHIDEILSFEELDGVMIGPYDLSGSLNIPGKLEHPLVKKATDRVISACQKWNKGCGIHIVEPDPKNVHGAFSSGHTFVVLSSDIFTLWKWSARMKGLISESRSL